MVKNIRFLQNSKASSQVSDGFREKRLRKTIGILYSFGNIKFLINILLHATTERVDA
jgi:hypothetical protein